MKYFIINSFRSMVYIGYVVSIAYGGFTGYVNRHILVEEFGLTSPADQILGVVVGLVGGWVVASIVAGLIVTLLDIRDDVNDILNLKEEGR